MNKLELRQIGNSFDDSSVAERDARRAARDGAPRLSGGVAPGLDEMRMVTFRTTWLQPLPAPCRENLDCAGLDRGSLQAALPGLRPGCLPWRRDSSARQHETRERTHHVRPHSLRQAITLAGDFRARNPSVHAAHKGQNGRKSVPSLQNIHRSSDRESPARRV
jgi:hypothetical protein